MPPGLEQASVPFPHASLLQARPCPARRARMSERGSRACSRWAWDVWTLTIDVVCLLQEELEPSLRVATTSMAPLLPGGASIVSGEAWKYCRGACGGIASWPHELFLAICAWLMTSARPPAAVWQRGASTSATFGLWRVGALSKGTGLKFSTCRAPPGGCRSAGALGVAAGLKRLLCRRWR